jgi:hypothetical protein
MVAMESQLLLWKTVVAMLFKGCYGKSLVAMEINGCYGKTKVAMKSKWLLLKASGCNVCHWFHMESHFLLWK